MSGVDLIAVPVLSIEAVPGPALLHLSDYDREIAVTGYVWLHRRECDSSWTLIDAGTEDTAAVNANRPPRRRWQATPLLAAIGRHGVKAEDIGDVILTHLHHDHCGGIEQLAAARWHVPALEWELVGDPARADLAPEPLYPRALVTRMARHGVSLTRDDDEPVAGLRVKHLGGHTIGSIAVEVLDRSGKIRVVLAGDVMPRYENLARAIPSGTLWHWGECRRALQRLAAYTVSVLPSHDPELMQVYPNGVILDGTAAAS